MAGSTVAVSVVMASPVSMMVSWSVAVVVRSVVLELLTVGARLKRTRLAGGAVVVVAFEVFSVEMVGATVVAGVGVSGEGGGEAGGVDGARVW